ncbi:MAG: hypothetical protein L0G57_08485 [Acinetobacter sp.]|nr:hypothetical protein [Acinetobacter sp.]
MVHPGATHDINNAWVLALGTKLNF